jgi:hypothetical protein
MTLAVVLVLIAAVTLILIVRITISRGLQLSASDSSSPKIEPIDIEAFRNLIDTAEGEYLYRRLPAGEFRRVQRERLRAAAAYIRVAGHNAAVLVTIGQAALATTDPQTAEAARQLVDRGLLLRRNATVALLRVYVAMAWPQASLAATPVLNGYEGLSSSAMLLGRLQNPAVPVRISVRS